MLEDLVADVPELRRGRVEERPTLELLGVRPVRDALEAVRVLPELVGDLARVGLGQGQARRLDGDDDLIGVGELPGVLGVALQVGAAAREEVLPGRDEGELAE